MIVIKQGSKKGSYKVEVVSDVNGKTLTNGREVTQKVSVFTQLVATAKEFGVKKGKVLVYDETVLVDDGKGNKIPKTLEVTI